MKLSKKSFLFAFGGLLALPAAVVSTWTSTGCEQPSIDCRAARGDFAVRFEQTDGDPASACGGLTAGFVGLQSFYPADGTKQNYDKVQLAIQTEIVGGLLQFSQSFGPEYQDTTNKPYAFGDFTSTVPDESGVCTVPTLAASEQNIPEIPGEGSGGGGTGGGGTGGGGTGGGGGMGGMGGGGTGGAGGGGGMGEGGAGGAGTGGGGEGGAMACPEPPPEEPFPGNPATDIKAEFSNVKLYVTPNAPGTQFVADMKLTQTVDGDSCTASYRLTGIWPVVDCGVYEFDDCGNLTSATANDDACHLDPANAPPGSVVINPEFDTVCDPDLLICVAKSPVTALK